MNPSIATAISIIASRPAAKAAALKLSIPAALPLELAASKPTAQCLSGMKWGV